jgi:hypothetical protein
MSTFEERPPRRVSGWAVTGVAFAAVLLMIVGIFQIVAGLTALFDDEFYVVARNYTFEIDVTFWGVVHLLVGAAMLATGVGLFAGSSWAAVAAIVFASVSAITNFFFIPFYPLWSLAIIALDVWVIWALTRPGVLDE